VSAPLAALPALPLHEAGKYVAAAYIVLVALILVYVAIMAVRLTRIERDLGSLLELSGRTRGAGGAQRADGGAGEPGGEERS
jgi:hypothetical protein